MLWHQDHWEFCCMIQAADQELAPSSERPSPEAEARTAVEEAKRVVDEPEVRKEQARTATQQQHLSVSLSAPKVAPTQVQVCRSVEFPALVQCYNSLRRSLG